MMLKWSRQNFPMTPDQEILDLLRSINERLNDVAGELDELFASIEILNRRLQTLAEKVSAANSLLQPPSSVPGHIAESQPFPVRPRISKRRRGRRRRSRMAFRQSEIEVPFSQPGNQPCLTHLTWHFLF